MSDLVLVIGLAWAVVLLAGGGLALIRARGVLSAVAAFDFLTYLVVTLLALLAYTRQEAYYLDAALALALLSFVATLAAARSSEGKDPF